MATEHSGVPSPRDDRRPLADRVKDLDGFIPELRGRLDRGEYAGLGHVDLGQAAPLGDPELVLRILLADWDHFDDLPRARRNDYRVASRRLTALADLDALRQQLDGETGEASLRRRSVVSGSVSSPRQRRSRMSTISC
jgi:hypothetical protein